MRCIFCSIGSVNVTLPTISLSTLAVMSVGRLLYLKKPLRYGSIVTPARVLALLVIVWVVTIFIALPPYVGFGSVAFSNVLSTCVPRAFRDTNGLRNVYYVMIFVAIGIILLVVLMVMYIWIICISRQYILKNPKRFALWNKQFAMELNSLSRKGQGHEEKIKKIISNASKQQQFRMVQVLGAIFLTNIITWIPMFVFVFAGVVGFVIPTFCWRLAYIYYHLEIMLHPLLQIVLIYELKETVQRLWLSFKNTFCICFSRAE